MSLIDRLPKVDGEYKEDANLSKLNWFGVGGNASVLFKPKDIEDLSKFIKLKEKSIDIFVLGVGSNILIRDGGIDGVVIRLTRGFTDIILSDNKIIVGCGALNFNVANFAKNNSKSGLEFLSGIPGSIGGAIAMNAGAYGSDMSEILDKVEAISPEGNIVELSNNDLKFVYRGNGLNKGWIFCKAFLNYVDGDKNKIHEIMTHISNEREKNQPIHEKTGGSSFKNPPGYKAWKLIDEAGCRGMKYGGASVSDKHCNFFINENNAKANDIEELGNRIKEIVKEKHGIELEWEIKIIGKKL